MANGNKKMVAVSVTVHDALSAERLRMARRVDWRRRNEIPSYSDVIEDVLRKGGYLE
jgi:hypothetical protein